MEVPESRAPLDVTAPPSRWRFVRGRPAQVAGLGLLLAAAYGSNGDFLTTSDSLPNMYLPVSLIREGDLTFTPDEMPFMFPWVLQTGNERRRVRVRQWTQEIDGSSAAELRREGRLRPDEPHYYLSPSRREGEYVGIYGPGPGLAATPFYAAGMAAWGDLRVQQGKAAWIGKIAASVFVAASAIFLFLAGRATLSTRAAWVVALAYGLGTCVWSQSSQALWQQTPVLFFLALGVWAFLRKPATRTSLALCGLGLGAAVLCRPTWGILLLAAALWFLKVDRRGLLHFAAGAAGPLLFLAAYAALHLESVLDFGQMDAAAAVALRKTGSMDVWSTPPWLGAAGMLASPSRGLLVFSPFLAFAGWGAWVAWREESYRDLRPLSLALAGLLLLTFRWFDWWGGHSFGYRLIVDTVPLFVALLFPVADRLLARPVARRVFGGLILWSIGVQVLGAFAYDQDGWNARAQGYEVRLPGEKHPSVAPTREAAERLARDKGGEILGEHRLDVDLPEYRGRLWSAADNPIGYYAAHFLESRAVKKARLRAFLERP